MQLVFESIHKILKYRFMVNCFHKMNLRLKQFQGEHPNNVAVCIIFRPQRCNYYYPQHLWHFTRKRPTHVSVGHQWITRRSASGSCNWEYGLLSAQTVSVHPHESGMQYVLWFLIFSTYEASTKSKHLCQ